MRLQGLRCGRCRIRSSRKVTTHASLSDFRGIYAGAVIAQLIIGFGVYIVAGFNLSSVIFFLFSLEQMAGRFVI